MADLTPEQRAELIALGWRAPGPPTEEEVERAARAIVTTAGIDPDKPVVLVQAQPAGGSVRIVKGPFWKEREPLARIALTAALGRQE